MDWPHRSVVNSGSFNLICRPQRHRLTSERRESCDETGVLDEDDPHFVRGPAAAPLHLDPVLLCARRIRAEASGAGGARGSDTV